MDIKEVHKNYYILCRSTLRSVEVVGLSDTCDITLFQHVHHVRVTDLTLLGAPLGEQAMTHHTREEDFRVDHHGE